MNERNPFFVNFVIPLGFWEGGRLSSNSPLLSVADKVYSMKACLYSKYLHEVPIVLPN